MPMTRRDMMALATGSIAAYGLNAVPARASATDEAIAAFTGGLDPADGGLVLDVPEIAENGNAVPVSVSADGAVAILVVSTENPLPGVATFRFGPLAASSSGSTRIRLARSQDVIAVAKMEDGTFRRTSASVKVTVGGCGG
ncbi:MAG: thiosulfate oxidation carrier protein SoxY [Boseongicola sp. SB0675_bin_26]|nr:thiosulfate oxidation carrier protein SoxY [Boseongicola sp. SB0675_bin_26]